MMIPDQPVAAAARAQIHPSTVLPVATLTAAATARPVAPATETFLSPQSGGGFPGGTGARLPPLPDPDPQTGPPPTFEANLLEAERRRPADRPGAQHGPAEDAGRPAWIGLPGPPGPREVDVIL